MLTQRLEIALEQRAGLISPPEHCQMTMRDHAKSGMHADVGMTSQEIKGLRRRSSTSLQEEGSGWPGHRAPGPLQCFGKG